MKNRRGSGSGKKSGLKKENGFLFLSSVIGKGKKSKKNNPNGLYRIRIDDSNETCYGAGDENRTHVVSLEG